MSTSTTVLYRAIRTTLLASLSTLALADRAAADQPAVAASGLDEITVFGSRAGARTVFDSAVPIDVFAPADVQAALRSGEVGQALQALSPSINMPRASASGTSDSVRTLQFRGLAPDQLLVLVNGKRRHTNAVMDIEGQFPGTVAVDVNAIPPSAIDHIEVLRDGAGAVYGSDAIAGVVNIVLKSDTNGGEIGAGYGENHTHFAPTGSSISDGRNRTVGFDYGLPFAGTGTLHFGADYQNRGSTNRAGYADAAQASYNATPADLATNDHVVFRSGDPKLESKGLFYDGKLGLDGGVSLYSFATAAWRDTEGAAFFRYPGDPTNVAAIYPNGFLPVSTGKNHDIDWVAGLRGKGGSWDWDLSGREGYNTFSYGLEHSLNASLGAASPTSFHVANFTYEERALNLDLSRELALSNSAAPLNIAAGLEYMHEAYHTSPGDPASYAAGPFTSSPPGSQGDNGLPPADTVHLSRSVESAYLDLDQDLGRTLLVGVAGRYSHYSDFGSATTGKFTVRYKLTDDLLIRGAVSNSFRAPALAQTGIRFETLAFNSTGTGLQNSAFLPPGAPLAQGQGALPLKPEKSTNYTAGIAWRAGSQLSASADVYQIRIHDRIVPTGQIPVTDPTIASVQFLTNGLDTTTKGLDIVVSNKTSLSEGTLLLSAAFNRGYTHEDGLRGVLGSPGVANETVLVPLIYGSPSTKLIFTLDYTSNNRWGIRLQPTRYGTLYAFSYDPALPTLDGANVQKYGSAWTFDADLHYDFTADLTGSIGGYNVTNRYPDRSTPGGSYYGALPYNYANPIGINGAYYYAQVTLKLGKKH